MMIATFGVYLVLLAVLVGPFIARYLFVVRQDRHILHTDPVQMVHHFGNTATAQAETEVFYENRFLTRT